MELKYKKYGSGTPFIILHGLFGSSDNWHTHGKKLAEYFEVYLVDQRNHGESEWSDDFSYDLMAEDIHEFVKTHELEDFILMGHSMGGKTAMRYAQMYPKKIKKLIVVDMGIKEYPITHQQIIEGLQSINLEKIKTRKEANNKLSEYVKENTIRQFLLKNLNRHKKGYSWKVNLEVLDEKLPEIVKALPEQEVLIEALFISGGQSDYILPEDKTTISNRFPLASFYSIEKAGHWIHAEAPEEFMEEVLSFSLL